MIRKANMQDIHTLTELALMLWPENSAGKMRDAMEAIMAKEDAAFFIAYKVGQPIGFEHIITLPSLR